MSSIPKNLEECFVELKEILSCKEVEIIKAQTEESMANFHHSLGRQLRNDWGLWKNDSCPLAKWFRERGIFHADDMSGIILTSFWRRLDGQTIRLKEQIKHFQDYWKKESEKRGIVIPRQDKSELQLQVHVFNEGEGQLEEDEPSKIQEILKSADELYAERCALQEVRIECPDCGLTTVVYCKQCQTPIRAIPVKSSKVFIEVVQMSDSAYFWIVRDYEYQAEKAIIACSSFIGKRSEVIKQAEEIAAKITSAPITIFERQQ